MNAFAKIIGTVLAAGSIAFMSAGTVAADELATLKEKGVMRIAAWDGIIGGLLANKYDAIVGSMSITEERSKVVDFVGPYYTTKRAIFTKAGSPITSVSQLGDVTIGVTLGETHEQWAREQGYTVKTYKGLPELLLELENGRHPGRQGKRPRPGRDQ